MQSSGGAVSSGDFCNAEFSLDAVWQYCSVWAHLYGAGHTYTLKVENGMITAEDCVSLSSGIWDIYLSGERDNGRGTKTGIMSSHCRFTVQNSGDDDEIISRLPATPVTREQTKNWALQALELAQRLEDIVNNQAFKGPQGEPGEKGDPGADGANGADGADGYSPTLTVASISGGHRITITDASGTNTVDVMDGTGAGDMLASVYDPSGGAKQVAFADGIPSALSALSDDAAHRLVTDAEKLSWNGKGSYSKPAGGIPVSDLSTAVQTSLGKADSALQSHQDISGKESLSHKVTSVSSSSTDTQYPTAKCVYDLVGDVESALAALR